MGPLAAWGHFSAQTAIFELQIWRFISFQFLHASLAHLIFNMIGLYFFGPMVESYLGARRFMAFYLLCGIMGAVSYLLLWAPGVLVTASWIPLVGASAGIFGILIAGARLAPDAVVMLLFPPIPMRLNTLAWVLIGIGIVSVVFGGPNAGGQAAHLGGAALGYVLIRRPQLLDFAGSGRRSYFR
jgi:membrane associated rhomboid family serine protease